MFQSPLASLSVLAWWAFHNIFYTLYIFCILLYIFYIFVMYFYIYFIYFLFFMYILYLYIYIYIFMYFLYILIYFYSSSPFQDPCKAWTVPASGPIHGILLFIILWSSKKIHKIQVVNFYKIKYKKLYRFNTKNINVKGFKKYQFKM